MNLLELLWDANRKLDHGEITIGEYEKIIEPLKDAVPVKHGQWLWRNYPGYQYQCDQCERWAMFESKFCPNCGALMKWWKDGDNG